MLNTLKDGTKEVSKMRWVLEDHLCKGCGGRILRCVSGGGPTPGGNPIYRCADCSAATSSMGPQDLCWCGYHSRRNHHLAGYVCVPYKILETYPKLKQAFASCGSDPSRGGDIGIMLVEQYKNKGNLPTPADDE